MRKKRDYVILTFRTTTDAMAMEAQCAACGIAGRLIPIPREQYEQNRDAIAALHIPFEQIVSLRI